ncbi:type VII secretion integral membrane protein EccD [Saccharopolyspora sp. NPDC000359]|uniref:type VII secretion integral membrane protein EccD n=1 Tax=Saccharopolyspora sp. NPDC000359 TaxID=3154251 RepID=UPI00332A4801
MRLRLIVGSRSVELAVPTEVPFADLLPAVLRNAGQGLADLGVEHEGWVLQRFGHVPLDENRTAAELDLVDGETVHMRPRAEALPEIDFDDLVDGIAGQVRARPDRWNDGLTRWTLLAFAGLALLLGWTTLAVAENALLSTVVAGASALALVAVAGAAARAKSATVTGTVLAVAAVCYAALCGWFLPVAVHLAAPPAAGLACGSVLALLVSVLALFSLGDATLFFVALLLPAAVLTVVLLFGFAFALRPDQCAALGVALCLTVLSFVPTLSFRLAGFKLPDLPSGADELDEDTDPVPYREVVDRAEVAARYIAALTFALTALTVVLFAVAISAWQLWQALFVAVAALLLLLRARSFDGRWARWPMLVGGGCGGAAFWAWLLVGTDPLMRLVVLFPAAVALVFVLVLCSRSLPGAKPRPYWGRAVDIVEVLVAVALVPLLLAVLDVYAFVQGLAG